MSKSAYIIIATIAILFGTFYNYSMVSVGQGNNGRTYVPSGGSSGGFSGGHK